MNTVNVRARKLSNGKTTYEYSFEIAPVDGKRKRITKSGYKTKKEARQAGELAQQVYESTGASPNTGDISYSDFLDIWFENDVILKCNEKTRKSYRSRVELYIKPKLGMYRLKTLDKNKIQTLITEMYDKGYSINTIAGVRALITNSLDFALDNNYISTPITGGIKIPTNKMPKNKTNSNPHVYITESEIKKIKEAFPEGSSFYVPFMVGLHCGLRLSEIYGLVWEDIDFENKTLKVNRQLHKKVVNSEYKADDIVSSEMENGYWYFCQPKYKSYRVIDLDDTILEVLKKEYQKQKEFENYYDVFYSKYYCEYKLCNEGTVPNFPVPPENRLYDSPNNYPVNFVMRRENGKFLPSWNSAYYVKVIKTKLGIEGFDMHSLRHTHATILMENGVDLTYIQHRLGHKNPGVTMNIYTNHMTEKLSKTNSEKLNNIFG